MVCFQQALLLPQRTSSVQGRSSLPVLTTSRILALTRLLCSGFQGLKLQILQQLRCRLRGTPLRLFLDLPILLSVCALSCVVCVLLCAFQKLFCAPSNCLYARLLKFW